MQRFVLLPFASGAEQSVKRSPLMTHSMKQTSMCCLISYIFVFALQEMYKASKYEVSPDLKHVLLAYNVAPVSFSFVCLYLN